MNKLKKIFYIDANNDADNLNYELLKELEKVYDVFYFSSKSVYLDEFYLKIINLKKAKYIFFHWANKIPHPKFRKIAKGFEYILNLIVLYYYIHVEKPDVIHFTWIIIPKVDFIFIRLIKKIFKIKIIVSAHNFGSHENKKLAKKHFPIFKIADNVLTYSNFIANEILKLEPNIPVKVIDHGNSYMRIVNYYKKSVNRNDKKNEIVILFTGSIRPYKGIDLLLHAFNLLDENILHNVTLKIIGKVLFEDIKRIKNLISENKNKDHIIFKPEYLPYQKLINEINNCTFGILPYKEASQSGLIYLYFTLYKPLVITKVGGLPEMVSSEISVLAEPTVEDLKNKIEFMILKYYKYNKKNKFIQFLSSKKLENLINKYKYLYN
jgi:glycosyltransferase involved in cell wall biosynthesis